MGGGFYRDLDVVSVVYTGGSLIQFQRTSFVLLALHVKQSSFRILRLPIREHGGSDAVFVKRNQRFLIIPQVRTVELHHSHPFCHYQPRCRGRYYSSRSASVLRPGGFRIVEVECRLIFAGAGQSPAEGQDAQVRQQPHR